MKRITIICLLFFLFNACQNASESSAEQESPVTEASADMSKESAPSTVATGLVSSDAGGSANYAVSVADSTVSVTDSDKKEEKSVSTNKDAPAPLLIKTGYLTIEVKDYSAYRKTIQALVSKYGGYIGNESEVNESYRIYNDIVIRIPSASFDRMMNGLMESGIKTDSKRVEVKDVGEEYADLQARIIAKKAIEKRYLDILNKAGKISDILEVEEKLRVIREETEAAQGRVKYLSNQVAYSTINLNFYKVVDSHYTPPSGPGFFSRIWKGLVKGWEGILEFLIALVYLWPLWVVLILIIFYFRRRNTHLNFWPFRKKQP